MGDGFRQFSIGLTKPEISSIGLTKPRQPAVRTSIPSIGLTNSLTCPYNPSSPYPLIPISMSNLFATATLLRTPALRLGLTLCQAARRRLVRLRGSDIR